MGPAEYAVTHLSFECEFERLKQCFVQSRRKHAQSMLTKSDLKLRLKKLRETSSEEQTKFETSMKRERLSILDTEKEILEQNINLLETLLLGWHGMILICILVMR